MGVGKTERLGINTSRFGKGRRVDEANDRIIRNLKIKGGKIRKRGDSWQLEVNSLTDSAGSGSVVNSGIPDGTAINNLLRWNGDAWVEIGPYEEETVNLVTDTGIITRKILVETASKANVKLFGAGDEKKLLQVVAAAGSTTVYSLDVDYGYLLA